MKIIHTSDWHIGRSLYGRKRYQEHEAFLDWLAETIANEQIDALLVAGDVFDNSSPSNRAQELYYRFLCRVAGSDCRHVVVIAGNHDSPSFLNAPKNLLKFLNVHVVGSATEARGDEVLVLADAQGEAELIVCAVPYLRDRDIRTAEAGETLEDKERKLVEGVINHYTEVCAAAERTRSGLPKPVPLIAMGHLFTAGGQTVEGDGVRELYVGSLAHVASSIFPKTIDYLALGHLHVPQKVDNSEVMRYCGSPLPMGFGEAAQKKHVLRVEFTGQAPVVTGIPVPRFQALQRLSGDWQAIAARLQELKSAGSTAWLEIVYEGEELAGGLRERLEEITEDSGLEILRVKNNRVVERALSAMNQEETLDDLDIVEVFARCLELHEVPEGQRAELLGAYREVLTAFYEDDARAQ